jgi:ribonuclease VapC
LAAGSLVHPAAGANVRRVRLRALPNQFVMDVPDKVKAILDGAIMSTMNLAQIVSRYAKLSAVRENIEAMLRPLPVRLMRVDAPRSYEARTLRPNTPKRGLFLCGRHCVVLVRREGLPAPAAERGRPEIAKEVGVDVELIR